MSRIDNLNRGEFADILRRLRTLETASPMNNGAVGRSGFEVYDGGTINISDGHLIVNGTAVLSGSIRLDALPSTNQKPNLYVDSNGYLYRSTAESGS